jgi:hypothetical protein
VKRWHQEFHIAKRNWKNHRRMHVESNIRRSVGLSKYQQAPGADPFIVDCQCDEQIGRFRKKDAYDCGITRCPICHSDKFPSRYSTIQEDIADLNFKEQLKEL